MVDSKIDILQVKGEVSDALVGHFVTKVAEAQDADEIEACLEDFAD
jgi:hypothetical protein